MNLSSNRNKSNQFYSICIIITFISTIILLCSCRDQLNIVDDGDIPDYEYSDIVKGREQRLTQNDFRIGMNENGLIFQAYRSYSTFGWPGFVYGAGLWIAGHQNGQLRANIIGIQGNLRSSYEPEINTFVGDVYYVVPSMLDNPLNNWPQSFPRNAQDEPTMVGDEMCWVRLKSNAANLTGVHRSRFDSLKVSQSIYGFENSSISNVLFVRYLIENETEYDLTEIYLGYYRDIDFFFGSTNGDYVGYDSQWQISYTFSKANPPEFSRLFGVGCVILKNGDNTGTEVELDSHRYISRDDSTNYGEGLLTTQSAYYALQGLDNDGVEMVNPVSGESTRYAFDGNPETREGWVDNARDTRSLLSVGPVSIPSEGSREFIVAMYVAEGADLNSLIMNIKLKGSELILNSQYWSSE